MQLFSTTVDGTPARYEWWPIRVHPFWKRRSPVPWIPSWFKRHGIVHWRRDRRGRVLVTQVWHMGPVKVILGPYWPRKR